MRLTRYLNRRRCLRRGHDWFPSNQPREFIPITALCFRCGETKHFLPYGTCLGNHPMRQHYDVSEDNNLITQPAGTCKRPY